MPAEIVSINSDGRVKIPKDIRNKINLKENDRMLMFNEDGFIVGMKISKKNDEALIKLMNIVFKKNRKQKNLMKKLEKVENLLKKLESL